MKNSNQNEVLRNNDGIKLKQDQGSILARYNVEGILLSKEVYDEKKYQEQKNEAKSTKNQKRLYELSKSENSHLRYQVAGNPNANEEIIKILLEDEDENIRAKIACRKDLSEIQIKLLSKDESEKVRYKLTQNPIVTVSILKEMSENEDSILVINGLITNPNLPDQIVDSYAFYPEDLVQWQVAARTQNIKILKEYSSWSWAYVSKIAMENPNFVNVKDEK